MRALEDAFDFFINLVSKEYAFEYELWNTGFFTYLLTKKQISDLKKLCKKEGWEEPNHFAITIKGEFVRHILNSRERKDQVTVEEASDILKAAFSPVSLVSINKKYEEQAVVLNSKNRIKIKGNTYYSAAFFEVGEKLENKTAYHTGYRKIEAILKYRDE